MGGTGRNAEPPGEKVPANGGYQPGKDDLQVDKAGIDGAGDRIADLKFANDITGDKKSGKIENCRPKHCLERCQHLCRNDGRYGVGCVMEPVDIIEHQSKDDNYYQKAHTLSSIFNNDGLYDIGRILTFVSHDLHHLVDLPFFDHLFRVGLRLEKAFDAEIEYVIRLVLDAVDLYQRIG